MIYFDTSYLVRLYLADPGYEKVRSLAATAPIASSILGRIEVHGALHRKFREGSLSSKEYRILLTEFSRDCEAGAFRWLPLSGVVTGRCERVFSALPAGVFLRSADALHLASASENRFREIHSNDRNLLTAAPYFDLNGVDILAG